MNTGNFTMFYSGSVNNNIVTWYSDDRRGLD
jgi:hypothetical protein